MSPSQGKKLKRGTNDSCFLVNTYYVQARLGQTLSYVFYEHSF